MSGREVDLEARRIAALPLVKPAEPALAVGLGTCGIGNGAEEVFGALKTAVAGSAVLVKRVGCFGFCAEEPLVSLYLPGRGILLFTSVTKRDIPLLAQAALYPKTISRVVKKARARIAEWDFRTAKIDFGTDFPEVPLWNELDFFKGQEKLVLRDCGLIDPENIDEYIAVGGYAGLRKAVTGLRPEEVIAEVAAAGLRGRGGAGFSTAKKWELMRVQPAEPKYVICNADEGDPGAYMNRNEIESDPHMLIEGMAIGAFAMGARHGLVYMRAEYPLAVERFRKAVGQARDAGLLGEKIFGTNFSFDIELVQGAGAFVCGEETALIASAEGKAGRPIPRPPFPAQKGFNGLPTTINNVETWCNVPVIVGCGAAAFSSIGTKASPGTKVFSLVGKVRNTGLVELPLGTRLDSIVYGMGGGAGPHKKIKAVQTGGPSGGCIPQDKFDVAVDYESLAAIGAIMGSGGMVVMDSDNCMVDVARYFVGFTSSESCGKCAPCREGLAQMLRILNEVSRGRATEADLAELEALARVVKDASLCGLGQTAGNPVLTTLAFFREEYERHIREKRCDAGVCELLYIALCENSCPLHMNIPAYLQLLKEGRLEEAFESTLRDNPLPGTVGRICHFHCRMRCRRETLDEAVAQGDIHRYLADTMYKMGREKAVYAKLLAEMAEPTGKTVSIIGAGPAGLTAAFYLSRLGHQVTIYDEHEKAGGVLRYGIPAYRLPHEVLDKELKLFNKLGVQFCFGSKIGKDIAMLELVEKSDAVLIAVGAQGDQSLGIPGEDLKGVYPGYQYLEEFNRKKSPPPGKRIVVIGGGNVAIDAARTLIRLGSSVTVAYRRTREDMPANHLELLGAEEEGISFVHMMQPEAVLGDEEGKVRAVRFQRMKPGRTDKSGRPMPMPTGEYQEIPADAVLIAIGEKVIGDGLVFDGIKQHHSGAFAIGAFNFRTGASKVYAAGDAVSGPATAAEAMGLAKKAAQAIDLDLMGEERFDSLERHFEYKNIVPLEPMGSRMNRAPRLPVDERRGNFQEIASGFSGEQALDEAFRCLRCDVRAR